MNPHFELHLPRRPRRLRRSPAIRNLVEETTLTVNDLVAPLFVKDGSGPSESIASMPDQFRLNMDDLLRECEALLALGVEAVGPVSAGRFRPEKFKGDRSDE